MARFGSSLHFVILTGGLWLVGRISSDLGYIALSSSLYIGAIIFGLAAFIQLLRRR